jgi:hypothetical protein
MILIQCTQGSEEWHAARAGVITASMFKVCRERVGGLTAQQALYVAAIREGKSPEQAAAAADYKTKPRITETVQRAIHGLPIGDFSDAAKKYAFRLAIERISGQPLDNGFETWQMKRGHELEPKARARHEEEAGVIVETAGFVKTDDSCFGASADGLIGNDGGSEYKCLVSPDSLMPVLLENDIAEYIDQIQGCMWITGRKWWHFGLYCPALEPAKLDLYWKHIDRDDDYIEALERDLIAFRALVLQYESTLRRKGSAANADMLHKAA